MDKKLEKIVQALQENFGSSIEEFRDEVHVFVKAEQIVDALSLLRDKYDFRAYYKPHPTAHMSESMRQLGWSIIDNPSMFPAVDLLISYQSTLVVEYAGSGVPAAVHAINLENEKSIDFLAIVIEKINAINYD